MRFTEHELTVAVAGAAKTVVGAQDKDVRRGKVEVDVVWNQMDRYARYQVLDSVGGQILPALIALPDIEVAANQRPSFTPEQVQTAVTETLPEDVGRMRRKLVLAARVALVTAALEALPVRRDPDGLLAGESDEGRTEGDRSGAGEEPEPPQGIFDDLRPEDFN